MTENITGNSSGNHHLQENAAAFDDDELYDCDTYDEGDDQSPLSDGMYEHFRFVADKGQQLLRVDKFLVDHMQRASRNRIQQAAEAGCILANGRPVKSNYRVKPDDIISVVMDRPRYEHEVIAEDIPLDIVYEDDTLLVVNKPAGLVVHPGHGNYTGTLVNALATTPITMSTTRAWGWCTVSTKTPPDFLW